MPLPNIYVYYILMNCILILQKNLLKFYINPRIFCKSYTFSVNNQLPTLQLPNIWVTFIWWFLPLSWKIFQKFEKILQIAHLVPKMNSPWLEYEKWYITSWYTVKSDFCQILPDFSGKTGFRIRWTGYPIQKFICVKTYLVQSKYYPNISAKLVK